MVTFNFRLWLETVGPAKDDARGIISLYKAVESCRSTPPFQCSLVDDKLYIAGRPRSKRLCLASENARQTFLQWIIERYCEGFPDLQSWIASLGPKIDEH